MHGLINQHRNRCVRWKCMRNERIRSSVENLCSIQCEANFLFFKWKNYGEEDAII